MLRAVGSWTVIDLDGVSAVPSHDAASSLAIGAGAGNLL
jgi:hypothetical protein